MSRCRLAATAKPTAPSNHGEDDDDDDDDEQPACESSTSDHAARLSRRAWAARIYRTGGEARTGFTVRASPPAPRPTALKRTRASPRTTPTATETDFSHPPNGKLRARSGVPREDARSGMMPSWPARFRRGSRPCSRAAAALARRAAPRGAIRGVGVRARRSARRGGTAEPQPTLAVMRFVFTAYLVLITAGLAFYIAIGITNHQ
jgi:hypothetical protein